MMTTLPSFWASATSLSQPGAADCARAWPKFLHAKADFFLVQDKVPIVGVEVVYARLGNDLRRQETLFIDVIAGRNAAAVARKDLEAFLRRDPVREQPGGIRVRRVVEQHDLAYAGRYDVRHSSEAVDPLDREAFLLKTLHLLIFGAECDRIGAACEAVADLPPVAAQHRLLFDIELFDEVLSVLDVESGIVA
jgi:hypothetical protein